MGLHFREDGLDGIEFWRVADVENVLHVQPRPPLPQAFGLVHVELVHEQSERLASVLLPELLEEVEKGLLVDGFVVSLAQAHATIFSHRGDHALVASVDVFLLDRERGVAR